MAKRYVIVLERIDGDEAVLNINTLRQLGLKEKDSITITSATAFYMLPAIAGNVGADQIKVPFKVSAVKEGDRLGVEPTSAPPAIPMGPAPRKVSNDPDSFVWDPVPDTGFSEVMGLASLKARIEQSMYYLTHPEWFLIRSSFPPRVFLLFGPYGCGKTMLTKAMASRLSNPSDEGLKLDVKLKIIKATDVKDPYLGMSARNVQQYLDAARDACNKGSTVLLVLDEIDSLVANRAEGNTHEEYRDIVNTFLQDIQGAKELDSELRMRKLHRDPEVLALRKELATVVRAKGRHDHSGDILLPEAEWTDDIRKKMLTLRSKVTEAGGVSSVIIVGTTNDPCKIDEGFLSRAGDNVFFVSRPPAEAIEQMLVQQLDQAFVDLSDSERRKMAEEAFERHLTGRDIMLSWLAPLRTMAPGSLTIMGCQSIRNHMPHPTVDIEWEVSLDNRLRQRGELLLANQVEDYFHLLGKEPRAHMAAADPEADGGDATGASRRKQPAVL